MTEKDNIFHSMNEDLTINTHDAKTGVILSTTLTPIELGIKGSGGKRLHSGAYSRELADCVCQFIMEGDTITKVSQRPGFPSISIIGFWRHINPDFDTQLKRALKMRALVLAESALDEIADLDKDDVPAAALRVKTLQQAAAYGDPDVYGNKTKVSGDVNAPLSFIIDTGIRRPGDEGYNIDEAKRPPLEKIEEKTTPTKSED